MWESFCSRYEVHLYPWLTCVIVLAVIGLAFWLVGSVSVSTKAIVGSFVMRVVPQAKCSFVVPLKRIIIPSAANLVKERLAVVDLVDRREALWAEGIKVFLVNHETSIALGEYWPNLDESPIKAFRRLISPTFLQLRRVIDCSILREILPICDHACFESGGSSRINELNPSSNRLFNGLIDFLEKIGNNGLIRGTVFSGLIRNKATIVDANPRAPRRLQYLFLLLVNARLNGSYAPDDNGHTNREVFREIPAWSIWISPPAYEPAPHASWEDWLWSIIGIVFFASGLLLFFCGLLIMDESFRGGLSVSLFGLLCATGGSGLIIQYGSFL